MDDNQTTDFEDEPTVVIVYAELLGKTEYQAELARQAVYLIEDHVKRGVCTTSAALCHLKAIQVDLHSTIEWLREKFQEEAL